MEVGKALISAAEIEAKITEMGRQITEDYEGRDLLVVAVLKGAFIVMADLARAIELPVQFDFMAVSSYGAATQTSGVVRILKDLDQEIAGRDVLVVEDIIDSGLTLNYLLKSLRVRRPASLEVAALLVKEGIQRVPLDVRYVGLQHRPTVRHRLRPRLRRPLSKPAIRGGDGGIRRKTEVGRRKTIPKQRFPSPRRGEYPAP